MREDMHEDVYISRRAATPALTSLGLMRSVADILIKRERQSMTASMGGRVASGPSVMRVRRHAISTEARMPSSSAYVSAAKELWVTRRCLWEPEARRANAVSATSTPRVPSSWATKTR